MNPTAPDPVRPAYVDEDVSKACRRLLSELGHDAIHTEEAGNKGQTDVRQLIYAVSHHRLFITANRRDFEALHEAWLACARLWGVTSRLHDGVLIVPNGREVVEILEREGDLDNRLLRWRHSTGSVERFPGARPVARNPSRREGNASTA